MYTKREIIKASGGISLNDVSWTASGFSIDSRTIKKGEVFIALKGENFDGHNFIDKAFENGAVSAISEKEMDGNIILVRDTFKALWDIARHNRNRREAKIIGITGSVGKTGTKELMVYGLKGKKVYCSKGNYNNHIGLPLSLANMPHDIEYGVFEMGMSAKGEIEELTKLLKPHIGIITNIAPAHLENFNSVKDIAYAKAEIVKGVKDAMILPSDSPYFELLKKEAEKEKVRVLEFSQKEDYPLKLSVTGKHWRANANAVLTAAAALDLDLEQFAENLEEFTEPDGRGKKYQIKIDDGFFTLIDDSYNANPASMTVAIENLRITAGKGKAVAVLGDMLELGETSSQLHKDLAKPIIQNKIDKVYTLGNEIKNLYLELPENIRAGHFDNVEELIKNLDIKKDDTVLVKGSNGIKIYQVAKKLIKSAI